MKSADWDGMHNERGPRTEPCLGNTTIGRIQGTEVFITFDAERINDMIYRT